MRIDCKNKKLLEILGVVIFILCLSNFVLLDQMRFSFHISCVIKPVLNLKASIFQIVFKAYLDMIVESTVLVLLFWELLSCT